jgi:hypothetical protein
MVGLLVCVASLLTLSYPATDIRFRQPLPAPASGRLGQPVREVAVNTPQSVTEHFSRVQPGLIGEVFHSVIHFFETNPVGLQMESVVFLKPI